MAIFDPHKGSWFGLPDFGLTEFISDLSGKPRDPNTGGSQNFQSVPKNNYLSGTVLGIQNTDISGAFNNTPTTNQNPQPQQDKPKSDTGGGGGSPTYDPASFGDPNNPDLSNDFKKQEYQKYLDAQNAANEARRREEETRRGIESGYNDYVANLRGLETDFGNRQQSDIDSASRTYETIFGGLTDEKQASMDKLAANRGVVETRKEGSIKDLKQNLSDVMRAATMQFGAAGAGDTSATMVMLPYAYTKLAGAQAGGIHKQANEQQFEIDQKEIDLDMEFKRLWNQTELEKESKLQGIKQYYGDAISKVKEAIAKAPLDKANALAALNMALLQEAKSAMRTLESDIRKRQDGLKDWALERMAQLNDAKIQLQGTSNFNPRDIVFKELAGVGAVNTNSGGYDLSFNPLALAQKRREEYLA